MLRLMNVETGAAFPVLEHAGGLLRMCVSCGRETSASSLTGVRTALVADMTRRVLEDLHTSQVLVALAGELSPEMANNMMIRPMVGHFDSLDGAIAALDGTVGLLVTSQDSLVGISRLVVSTVHPADDLSRRPLADATGDESALRLALLTKHHAQMITLTPECIRSASATLDRWRRAVAEWGTHASVRMPRDAVQAAYAAFDDNLDIPTVLRIMTDLEQDSSTQAGAKFETFVHLDRVLALDLVRYLGRGRS